MNSIVMFDRHVSVQPITQVFLTEQTHTTRQAVGQITTDQTDIATVFLLLVAKELCLPETLSLYEEQHNHILEYFSLT